MYKTQWTMFISDFSCNSFLRIFARNAQIYRGSRIIINIFQLILGKYIFKLEKWALAELSISICYDIYSRAYLNMIHVIIIVIFVRILHTRGLTARSTMWTQIKYVPVRVHLIAYCTHINKIIQFYVYNCMITQIINIYLFIMLGLLNTY